MVLPIHTSLKKMDQRVIEAAQDLGANPARVFLKVTLPLSMSGVISGITMVFMPSVTTFAINDILGGSLRDMLGNKIERVFMTDSNWNLGSAISLVMMVLILISLTILRKADPNNEGGGL
jgi:spermidine/putrescine transport system permease protein